MLLVAARERCNTFCLTGELSPCLESCVSVSPSRRFAYDRPVRRVHVLTNVTACCLTRGCISIPSTNRKRTGTWDPRRAVRSSRHCTVSKQPANKQSRHLGQGQATRPARPKALQNGKAKAAMKQSRCLHQG